MTRIALGLAILAGLGVLAGCGSAEPETKNEPYKASSPPPGWVEEKLKARDAAPKPGPAPETPAGK